MTQTVHEQVGDREPSLADITERLFSAFDGQLPLGVIIDVVREARADLAGTPAAALPELLERLASYRLREVTAQHHSGRDPS
jgi:hypothetical protein